jgi:hypothetical protein
MNKQPLSALAKDMSAHTLSEMKLALSWLLFTAESMGALMILCNGVPIHRRLLMGQGAQQADPTVFVLGTVAIALIQTGYWIRLRCFPSFRFNRHLVLGHAIQFLGRLSFVFIGGLFSVVFFTRFESLEFSIWKVLLLLAVLFSLFCYTLDLERIAKAFSEGVAEPAQEVFRS